MPILSGLARRSRFAKPGVWWRALAGAAALILVTLAVDPALVGLGEEPSLGSGRHVLVISVDGMRSSDYFSPPPGLRIPNLRRLMAAGSFAEAVEGVYPTLTYPSHTTLVTGRLPAEHGIYTNLSSREPGKNPRDWFWFASAIKRPTLWDEAHQHHLTSASVAWPVTAGASIDWDVPEIWDPSKPAAADALYVARFMNPWVTLQLLTAIGRPRPGSEDDANRTRIASYFLTMHKPNLTLVHLEGLDETQHASGPDSPAADQALERIDGHIAELLDAVKKAGLAASTDVFVVSDHGFLPVKRDIRPNVLLAKAGLLTIDSAGDVTGGKINTVVNDGSFFIYWPKGSDLGAAVDAALKPLREQGLVWAVLDRQALRDLGADPQASLALDAPTGAEFVADATGPLAEPLARQEGTHGFLPFRSGLAASFIATGPDVKAGIDLHRVRMTGVAPTILEALGIEDPKFGDTPPFDVIFKASPPSMARKVAH
jgi:predicted AlkP superfamily pyrophosphatase or phosphodiesterase